MSGQSRIAFLGGGNMARSLIGGMLQHGYGPGQICVADPSEVQRTTLAEKYSVAVSADNATAVHDADVVIFAVKPQVFREAARAVADRLAVSRPLVMSIAAGIAEPDIRRWLAYDAAIVRVMPNTPALVGFGASALYANAFVSTRQRQLAATLMEAVGIALWLDDEQLMDAVTAVSGSGPAYFFLVMEVMEAAAKALALPVSVARKLVLQTALGAAQMASASDVDAATLRQQVTSPGGTTAAALKVLQEGGLDSIFLRALTAARDRGAELSHQFGKESK
ncbi:MAG TPA: pyrroline-5-carboxylate reductase [Gammaproteobacteria bacterium]|nr:pyrroline-5-carboxylate reductase [Gammaproteobacteria bacterium]